MFRLVHLSAQFADLKNLDVVFSFNIKSCSMRTFKNNADNNKLLCFSILHVLFIISFFGKVTLYFCTLYFMYRNKVVYIYIYIL